jgi:hypothetical protein
MEAKKMFWVLFGVLALIGVRELCIILQRRGAPIGICHYCLNRIYGPSISGHYEHCAAYRKWLGMKGY